MLNRETYMGIGSKYTHIITCVYVIHKQCEMDSILDSSGACGK